MVLNIILCVALLGCVIWNLYLMRIIKRAKRIIDSFKEADEIKATCLAHVMSFKDIMLYTMMLQKAYDLKMEIGDWELINFQKLENEMRETLGYNKDKEEE